MSRKEKLFAFETKYPFLYDIQADGVPVYTCFRDGVLACLMEGKTAKLSTYKEEKGRIYLQRIWDSMVKLHRFRKKQTLVFTSAMYRRDEGRNLAAEYLMDMYPDAVVFEWPSRVDSFDTAYFSDSNRDRYCPLEWYLVLYKIYARLFCKKYSQMADACRQKMAASFSTADAPSDEKEQAAVTYLLENMPESFAQTACSHAVFRKLFKGYKHVRYAVDFWGSARENIIPVLQGEPESVELQHGVITAHHPGYIYPDFVKTTNPRFFGRTLLVYGEKTGQLLTEESVFSEEQVRVIGNPRIKKYKSVFGVKNADRKLILFTSQPYEQDGVAEGYYQTVISYLKKLKEILDEPAWQGYELAVKLHPRENNGASEIYQEALPGVTVHGNASQLYKLLCESFLQVTVSSTSLYEAAEFDTPTVVLGFANENHNSIFGFDPWKVEKLDELTSIMARLSNAGTRKEYTQYLKRQSSYYM